jgi:hypothetical protein
VARTGVRPRPDRVAGRVAGAGGRTRRPVRTTTNGWTTTSTRRRTRPAGGRRSVPAGPVAARPCPARPRVPAEPLVPVGCRVRADLPVRVRCPERVDLVGCRARAERPGLAGCRVRVARPGVTVRPAPAAGLGLPWRWVRPPRRRWVRLPPAPPLVSVRARRVRSAGRGVPAGLRNVGRPDLTVVPRAVPPGVAPRFPDAPLSVRRARVVCRARMVCKVRTDRRDKAVRRDSGVRAVRRGLPGRDRTGRARVGRPGPGRFVVARRFRRRA